MKILLLSGASGVGKTKVAWELSKDDRFHLIRSFTDRPKRTSGIYSDHQFVSNKIMKFILSYNLVAATTIDGYHYCSTFQQFDDKKINVYVVDKQGVDDVNKSFKDAQIISVLIIRDNINIDQSRKERNIVIPTSEDVDFVLSNNENIDNVVENLKQEALLRFGV